MRSVVVQWLCMHPASALLLSVQSQHMRTADSGETVGEHGANLSLTLLSGSSAALSSCLNHRTLELGLGLPRIDGMSR